MGTGQVTRIRVANALCNSRSLKIIHGLRDFLKGLQRYTGTLAFLDKLFSNPLNLSAGPMKFPLSLDWNIRVDASAKAILDAIPNQEWLDASFEKKTDLSMFINRFTDRETRVIFLGKIQGLKTSSARSQNRKPASYLIDHGMPELTGIAIVADKNNVDFFDSGIRLSHHQ